MSTTENSLRFQNAKALVEFATSIEPESILKSTEYPHPEAKIQAENKSFQVFELASKVTSLVVGRMDELEPDAPDMSQVLFDGINDLHEILLPQLKLQPTTEAAKRFIVHEKTGLALAKLAQHDEIIVSGVIQLVSSNSQASHVAEPYLKIPEPRSSLEPHNGCPAAKHSAEKTKPIWRNFISWVGQVSLGSIEYHKEDIRPAFYQEPSDALSTYPENLATRS